MSERCECKHTGSLYTRVVNYLHDPRPEQLQRIEPCCRWCISDLHIQIIATTRSHSCSTMDKIQLLNHWVTTKGVDLDDDYPNVLSTCINAHNVDRDRRMEMFLALSVYLLSLMPSRVFCFSPATLPKEVVVPFVTNVNHTRKTISNMLLSVLILDIVSLIDSYIVNASFGSLCLLHKT